jgi:predicted transposase YbfD/YdcC
VTDEIEQLRNDNSFLASQHIELRRDYEELMTAFNKMKKQGTEHTKIIVTSKDENSKLRADIMAMEEVVRRKETEIEDLRQVIVALEGKNKEFADTINHHFYHQARDYKERVLDVLKQSEDSRRFRSEIGFEASSLRLGNILRQEASSSFENTRPDRSYNSYDMTTEVIREKYRGRSTSPINSSNEGM